MEPLAALLSVVFLNEFVAQDSLDLFLMVVAGIMGCVSLKELLPEV